MDKYIGQMKEIRRKIREQQWYSFQLLSLTVIMTSALYLRVLSFPRDYNEASALQVCSSVTNQTTWPAFWEICMQVWKQQLELDMEQQTGSK